MTGIVVAIDATSLGEQNARGAFIRQLLIGLAQRVDDRRVLAYVRRGASLPPEMAASMRVVTAVVADGPALLTRSALAARIRTDAPTLYQTIVTIPSAGGERFAVALFAAERIPLSGDAHSSPQAPNVAGLERAARIVVVNREDADLVRASVGAACPPMTILEEQSVSATELASRFAEIYGTVLSGASPAVPAGNAGRAGRITTSVVSHGQADYLAACLASLEAQGLADALHITVVCNTPEDGSAEYVRGAHPLVNIIENAAPRSFSANHNAVLNATPSEFGLVLNPDVVLAPGCLAELVAVMRRNDRCGIALPALSYPDGRPQPSARRFPEPLGTLLRRTPLRHVLSPMTFNRGHFLPPAVTDRPVDWALGAVMLFRGAAWRDLGGFDEGYHPIYVEDIDIAWRSWQQGWEVWQSPAALAVHDHQAETDKRIFQRRTLWHWRGMLRFARKYPTLLAGLRPAIADATQARAWGVGRRD